MRARAFSVWCVRTVWRDQGFPGVAARTFYHHQSLTCTFIYGMPLCAVQGRRRRCGRRRSVSCISLVEQCKARSVECIECRNRMFPPQQCDTEAKDGAMWAELGAHPAVPLSKRALHDGCPSSS